MSSVSLDRSLEPHDNLAIISRSTRIHRTGELQPPNGPHVQSTEPIVPPDCASKGSRRERRDEGAKSFRIKWWVQQDSNLRPADYEAVPLCFTTSSFPASYRDNESCLLPILGKFCRFLHISAGFSHTDSHTESRLSGARVRLNVQPRDEDGRIHPASRVLSPGTHNHCVFSPDEISGRGRCRDQSTGSADTSDLLTHLFVELPNVGAEPRRA